MAIELRITADNSSGYQQLIFQSSQDGYNITLVGHFNGQPIQIDFDELEQQDIKDLIYFLKYHCRKKRTQTN